MSLPAPNLDDRTAQDLIDDAKRLIQQRCKEWTDHNVSDPGVTLIEAFAEMTEMLLYRLNRVPERLYLKFLELIGVELLSPNEAEAPVTFWLSAPQESVVKIPAGTEVATNRTAQEDAIVFSTTEDLDIVPCALSRVTSEIEEGKTRDHTKALNDGTGVFCFDAPPKPGDALHVGLSAAVPSCAVVLRFQCETQGLGVDPDRPPIRWQALVGGSWEYCDIESDETKGLNLSGDVVLHVPPSHNTGRIGRHQAGWLRCVVEDATDRPPYQASPKILSLSVATIGGTAMAANATMVEREVIGYSEGFPGQRLALKHTPVVSSKEPIIVEVSDGDGWQEWIPVPNFSDSTRDERHYHLDYVRGEISFGPAVRERDGTVKSFGAIPPKGAVIRVRSYRAGGGRRGNVARGALCIPKSPAPFVHKVENRVPAAGGVDVEDIESAKVRGPIAWRTANRAVTAEDFEHIAWDAAPEAARIRCLAGNNGSDPGAVTVVVVPATEEDEDGRIKFDQLRLHQETRVKIARALDERRLVGTRVYVDECHYRPITVVAQLVPKPDANPERLQRDALRALYHYFHPISGGPNGEGWAFGRPVHIGDAYRALQAVPGVEIVELLQLFPADPSTGERGEPAERIVIGPHELVFSYEHRVRVMPT